MEMHFLNQYGLESWANASVISLKQNHLFPLQGEGLVCPRSLWVLEASQSQRQRTRVACQSRALIDMGDELATCL